MLILCYEKLTMEVVANNFMPGDSRLVEQLVYELKSQGIFDRFRKECISDVDTKPAYQNLRQRVEGSVSTFLRQQTWSPDMNKNQVREQLRKNIYESGYLETGVERIVDQVVNPKINTIFLPEVEDVVYRFLGVVKPVRDIKKEVKINIEDLLPTDLEAVSPESVHSFKDDVKPEDHSETLNDSLNSGSKPDEDESPPFEPLDPANKITNEENSVDSHLSGFSGLQSHGSDHSGDNRVCQMEISSQDSQVSHNSSESRLSIITSEDTTKMDIFDDFSSNLMKSTTNKSLETSIQTKMDVNEIRPCDGTENTGDVSMEESLSLSVNRKENESSSDNTYKVDKSENEKCGDRKSEKTDENKSDKKYDKSVEKKSKSSDKYSKDKRDDKHRKSSSSSSSKEISSSSKQSSSKDRDRNRKDSKSISSTREKEKTDKNRDKEKKDKGKDKTEKERTDREKERDVEKYAKDKEKFDKDKSSGKDKERSDKSKDKSEREKLDKDKVKEKSSRDKEKSTKDKERDKSDKEKERFDKEKDKSDKEKERFDKEKERSDKEKERSDKEKERSDKEKERSDKEKDKTHRDKDKSDRERSSKDKDKSTKHREKSDKEKTDKHKEKYREKDKYYKEKSYKKETLDKEKSSDSKSSINKNDRPSSSSKKEHTDKEKPRSSNSSSSRDKSKLDNGETKSRSSTDKSRKESKHSVNGKSSGSSSDTKKDKDKKRDSKKQLKDDHYSSKDKKNDRRSTDRDSNDGHSSKPNFSGSCSENNSSRSEKSSQDFTSNSGSGDSGNSDQVEQSEHTRSEEPLPVFQDVQRLIKPKFASNFQEVRKIMKIRKQLAMLEKQQRLGFTHIESQMLVKNGLSSKGPVNRPMNKKKATKKQTNENRNMQVKGKVDVQEKKDIEENVRLGESLELICEEVVDAGIVVSEEVEISLEQSTEEIRLETPESPWDSTSLRSTELSQENWEALEARLAQEMSIVNCNSYDSDEEIVYSASPQRKETVEASETIADIAGFEGLDPKSSANESEDFRGFPKDEGISRSLELLRSFITDSIRRNPALTDGHFVQKSMGREVKREGNAQNKDNKQLSVVIDKNDMRKNNHRIEPLIENCHFLEKATAFEKENLSFLHEFIGKLEDDLRVCMEARRASAQPVKRGRKRKLEESVDMKNNNRDHYEQIIVRKRGRPPGSHTVLSKVNKEKLCNTADLLSHEKFSLPLSPAESDKSNDKKEEELLIPKKRRRIIATQRYSSEDLYKPRPVFCRRNKDARKS